MNGLHMSAYTDGISCIQKGLAGTGIGTIQLQLWFQPTNTAHRLLASSTNLEDEYTNSTKQTHIVRKTQVRAAMESKQSSPDSFEDIEAHTTPKAVLRRSLAMPCHSRMLANADLVPHKNLRIAPSHQRFASSTGVRWKLKTLS